MSSIILVLLLQSSVFVGPKSQSTTAIVTIGSADASFGILVEAENPVEAQRHVGYAFGMLASNLKMTWDHEGSKIRTIREGQEPVLNVNMPCGTQRQYRLRDFPPSDVSCPCGDQTHWLVKYKYRHRDYKK